MNGLYYLNLDNRLQNTISNKRHWDSLNPKYLWHLRHGHARDRRISKLEKGGLTGPLLCDPRPIGGIAKLEYGIFIVP